MQETDIRTIADWLARRGLEGASEPELLHGFCQRCGAAGLPLSRGLTILDTLHPIYEGRAFRWRDVEVPDEQTMVEFGRTNEGEAAEAWRRSVFYRMLNDGHEEFRRRLSDPCDDYNQLRDLGQEGNTDYFATVHRFDNEARIGELDCVYSNWTTRQAGGFRDTDLDALRRLVPILALASKCASLARIAGTLVEVYLGRDAGQMVLSGRISRGVADKISAVLWFSDLHGYTRISDTGEPGELIPLLNDYAEAVISAIGAAGGDVLKLIGDGVLAIFKAEDRGDACACALRAEADMRGRVRVLNARRTAENRPVTSVYLGLHIGEVFFGNIGSENRLDFTVVGPAVNEVSRIAAMCRSADRTVLLSDDFAAAAPERERAHIVSVGRYALRGVGRAQELFTLDNIETATVEEELEKTTAEQAME